MSKKLEVLIVSAMGAFYKNKNRFMGTTNNVRHYSNDILKDLNISIKSTDQEIINHMKNIKNTKINFNIEKRIVQRSVCLLGGILLWRRDKWVNDKFVRLLRKLGYFTN